MKNLQVFLILGLISVSLCGPVTKKTEKNDSDEVLGGFDDSGETFGTGVVDTAYPTSYFVNPFPSSFPFGNPFSGFWQSMEDTMRQLQRQMSQVLSKLPEEGDATNWKPIADGKGNTTSTVKIINGHRVTINETVYADNADKNSGSFFKLRVVQVNPTSEEDTESVETPTGTNTKVNKEVEETTPFQVKKTEVKGEPESFDEHDNEISRSRHPEKPYPYDRDVETFGEESSPFDYPDLLNQDLVAQPSYNNPETQELNNVQPVREIETNDVNTYPRDLSNDIFINQMLADQGYPHDPRSEVFDVEPHYQVPTNNDALYNPSYYYGG